MAPQHERESGVPGFVGPLNRIASGIIRAGVPMGPNALLTVRGRKSGVDRTTPVTLIEVGGRRWIQGAWGDSNWVRNLRAAGEGTITAGRRAEHVLAVELTEAESEVFFRDVLGPYARRIPFGRWLVGRVLRSRDILDDPAAAAVRHPVFELRAA